MHDQGQGSTTPNRPGGDYRPAVRSDGPLLHLAGQVARRGESMVAVGTVGAEVDLTTARSCAAQCARNLLTHMEAELGGLDEVVGLVRVNVYVAATPLFAEHSRVADAASAVLVERLGERGRHARSAIGVASLPRHSPVEVDCTVELVQEGRA